MVMRVILFDGQGSHPSSSSSVVQHPQSPLATLFVHQARAAFAARIASLASATRDALNDRATRILLGKISDGSIIIPSSDASLLRHPLIALPSLYVTQVVRLLEEVETNGPVAKGASVEVIGYSSGILPALLVATSFPSPKVANSNLSPSSQLTILRNALAIFAVAMSIGIEAQASKEAMLTECGIALDDPSREREWSAVVLGEKRDALETRLTSWNSQRKDHLRVHLTAETAASCHTVSGLPSALGEFLNSSIIPFGSRYTSASQISLLSSSSSTSDGSIRSDDNVISRRTPATSGSAASVIPLCPFLSQTPDNSSLLEHNPPFTSGVTRNATNLSQVPSTSKTLGIYTLFHANTPHLRAARDRVLSKLFPSSQENNTASSHMDTPDYPDYLRFLPNSPRITSSDEAVEISTTLSTLRVVDGFALHDVRTGSTVLTSMIGRKLVELVVDSILLDRIEFSNTVETLAKRATQCPHIEIINVGPGTGLARAAMRNLRVLFRGDTTLSDLSSSAKTMTSAKETPVSIDRRSQEPIAIVGMAVNFPGARDASELWRVLEQGLNTVEEIPETRFSISPYAEANASPGRQLKTRYGNFLPDGLHASFDNTFFRISPREARAMDPQMRVLMRTGLQAMEAAGLVVQEFAADGQNLGEGILRSEDVGCFVGVATNDYAHNLRNDIGVHYATGTLPAFLAGRLAYALHLSGPSIVLDTACSSSLVAIHQACRALLAGDCKAALAGGVNIVTSPDMYLGLDRAHFLSPTGNCKPWDASANGYCRAEGSGMFVLKRLSDALGCSDNILGVIRGTEVNQSAAAVSITRPHGPTQAALLRTLLDKADVRAEEISVVEAHGTGTQAGDPEELKSLRDVLSPNHGAARNPTNVLTVTSVKGNIGHAEAASGAASLAKVLLMLRHRAIPTQVGLASLNPKIESLEKDFTRINTSGASVEWSPGATGRRIALVNNFGAAGSNAAMLVEEAPSRNPIPFDHACAKGSDDHVFVGLSAESEDALIRLRDSYIMSITSIPDSSLVDFGYTTTARRRLRPWRIAVSADSATGLVRALSNARPICVSGSPILGKKTVFVFSGQGGQYVGMSRQLYSLSSSFRAIIDDCNEKLVNWGYPGILPIINGRDLSLLKNEELVAFQCAMFVLQCALCSMWESWGIKPDAVIGHSLGEYAALVVSGVLTRDAGLRLVAHRALLMTQRCEQNVSGMVAVRLPARYVSDMIAKLGGCDGLSVACHNGQHDVVVGGPRAQLEVLKAHLDLSGVKCATVDVPFAYHTAAMEPILEDMAVFARKFNFSAPVIPISSNVTGNVVSPGDGSVFCGEYLARHCRQVVRFEEGARALVGEIGSASAFVEIGPHPTTVPSIAHLASASGSVTLHTLHKRMTDRTALCSALSRLFVFRADVAWGRVYRDLYPLAKCIEIPGYPLQETEFWIPFVEEVTGVPVSATPAIDPLEKFFFLSSWTHKPSTNDANISEFETPITHLAEYITGHHVASSPLCPASVYYELALSAATCTLKYAEESFADALTLSDIQFTVPLVYDPANLVTVRTCINLHPKGGKHTGTFYVSSVSGEKEQVVHCTGFFQRRNKGMTASKLQLHYGAIERSKSAILDPENGANCETLRARTIYELIFSRVVQYSKLYQVINTMTLGERSGEAFATFRLSPEQANKGFVAQPIFVDALLHSAGFLINSRAMGNDAFICNQIDASKIIADIDYSATFEVYCITTSAGEGIVLADAWAIQAGESRRVVAHMKRMRFSRVRLSNLSRHLSRAEDTPSRNSTPAPFLRASFERCASPITPGQLGSPFRPAYRVGTPSSISSSADSHIAFNVTSEIMKLIADLCEVSLVDITLDSNVADLGIDSLVWIELVGQLRTVLPEISVDVSELMMSTTVGELVSKIAKAHHRCSFEVESPKTQTPFVKPAILSTGIAHVSNSLTNPRDSVATPFIVKEILGKVLDMPAGDLRDDDYLQALGLDSLGSIEALSQLQDQFEVSLPHDFFGSIVTVSSVQQAVANAINQRSHSRQSSSATLVEPEPLQKVIGPERTLLPFQTSVRDASPLFLVHDGSGLSHCYSRIGDLERPLWGISNPKLLSGESWRGGIPEMATHYIDLIKPMVTDNGCILGGWSFGGVVAFHMACDLMRAGVKVAGVVLIDSPSPFTRKPLPEELIDAVISASPSGSTKQQSRLIQLARTQMSYATKSLVAYEPEQFSSVACAKQYPNVVMLRSTDPFSLNELRSKFPLEPMPFLEDRGNPRATVSDWERLVGKDVHVLDIPGHHFEPFSPKNVTVLTQQLKKAIAFLSTTN